MWSGWLPQTKEQVKASFSACSGRSEATKHDVTSRRYTLYDVIFYSTIDCVHLSHCHSFLVKL